MKNNLLIVRADATHSMGIGHIMRCIALAQAWKKSGGHVLFCTHSDSDRLIKRITDNGFAFTGIPYPHPHPSDLRSFLPLIQNECFKHGGVPGDHWIVIDGYHFDPDYQKAVSGMPANLLVVDDYNHLPLYYSDIILNQNIGAENFQYTVPAHAICLAGTDYIMLRDEFTAYRDFNRPIAGKAKNILVTMGGSDPDNVTTTVVTSLNNVQKNLNVKIIVGPANRHLKTIKNIVSHSPHRMEILYSVTNMPTQIRWADLAISAGGSTCWEMCFMGLPMMLITIAENQTDLVRELSAKNACIHLGNKSALDTENFTRAIQDTIGDPVKRDSLSQNGRKLVDGRGVKRIIRGMVVGKLDLSPACDEHKELLWKWVNETSARQSAFNTEEITWEEHLQWFSKLLDNDDKIQLIAYGKNNCMPGQIRFDITGDAALVDYSIDASWRGLGLGRKIVETGIRYLKNSRPDIETVHAKVKKDNLPSNLIFKQLGFVPTSGKGYIFWQLEP